MMAKDSITPVPIARVELGAKDFEAVRRVLESGWLVQGRECERFERAVAGSCAIDYGVAVSSGTAALHVAMKALGVKPGDEVIVPAFTWVATAAMVAHCGARPVFCEIDPTTLNLAPDRLDELVSDRTVGVVPVHLFGLMADMDAVMEFAGRHRLWVLEDAACALGSRYRDEAPGVRSDAACFSFHPRKSITTGEGGMVVTRDSALAERCRRLRNHGIADDFTQVAEVGFNYRLTDIQAALGAAQMERFDAILAERRRLAARYDEALADLPWLTTPAEPAGCLHSYQSYVCLVGEGRNAVAKRLAEAGVMTRPGTHALPPMECFTDYAPANCPRTLRAAEASLAIPLFAGMTEAEQERVIAALRAARPIS